MLHFGWMKFMQIHSINITVDKIQLWLVGINFTAWKSCESSAFCFWTGGLANQLINIQKAN